jgi:hypothetical protein
MVENGVEVPELLPQNVRDNSIQFQGEHLEWFRWLFVGCDSVESKKWMASQLARNRNKLKHVTETEKPVAQHRGRGGF